MFKNMTVGTRLGAIFALLGIGLLVGAGVSLMKIADLKGKFDVLVKDRVPKILLVKSITDNTNQTARSVRNLMLLDKPDEIAREIASIDESRKNESGGLTKLEEMITLEKGKQILGRVNEERGHYRPALDKVMEYIKAGKKGEAVAILFAEARPAQLKYMEALNEISAFQIEMIDEAANDAQRLYERTFRLIAVAATILLVIAGAAGFATIRSITRELGGSRLMLPI